MKITELNEKRISSEVLIIGGGIAGLTAAVTCKETHPDLDVLVVEKQTSGYSGKANKGGGVLQYFDLENMKPEDFVTYHAHSVGAYLGNQDLMKKYVSMNNLMLDKLEAWGVKVPKKRIPTGPMTYMVGVDLDLTIQVRRTAEKLGVRFIDKVTVSDLLTDSGSISGAVGYSILDGTFYVFHAKTVILATGSQNYRFAPMWSSGRGDGIAAAYRAGAEMRNPEFGNFAQLYRVNSFHEVVFGENVMYNALGENITKNFRFLREADISSTAVSEWYKQMSSGKGPVVLHPEECPETENESMMFYIWDRPYGLPFWKAGFEHAREVDKDWEVVPGLVGEQSPVKVDENMQTTILGLYAAGDVCYCGSTAPGAVPAPPGRNRGSGILNAVFAGILSGEDAACRVKSMILPAIAEDQVSLLKERAYAPLIRPEGVKAKMLIDKIQELVCPMENIVYMSQHRLEMVLRRLEELKSMAENLKAVDFHDLLACHEAEAMLLSAEMQFKASEMRKESRGWFLREDYPEMDNKNWLKWITVRNVNDQMVFDTENVPIDQWEVKPFHLQI